MKERVATTLTDVAIVAIPSVAATMHTTDAASRLANRAKKPTSVEGFAGTASARRASSGGSLDSAPTRAVRRGRMSAN
jgi:hypothetical protein